MKLTRRDAIAVVAGGGITGYGLATFGAVDAEDDPDGPLEERAVETMLAVADVVYPSEVETTRAFVRRYLTGHSTERLDRVRNALRELDEYARSTLGAEFAALSISEREALLRRFGVDAVQPRPTGTSAERIRYHVVNGLLYALFTSPTGGRLVGVRSPKGHPGGYDVYVGEDQS